MIIEWFRQEGGSWITLGSDAHQPDHVGHELDLASQLADAAGFEAIARWEARRVSPQSIA
jgi:histidinol-phosphatase (PHP family)